MQPYPVLEVPHTILRQLGGSKFKGMTGARMFSGDERSLSFTLPKAKNGINKVKITLDASDTYTITFYKISGSSVTILHTVKDVYNDQLQEVFTENTGLATRL